MKVYVINHSEFNQTYSNGYIPLLVGAANKVKELKQDVVTDDTGDNISELNDSYCELTGLYWIWKNVEDPIVGLVHYRRFFLGIRHRISFRDDLFVQNPEKLNNCHLLTSKEVNKILNKNDILVKVSHTYRLNMYEKLLQYISKDCFDKLNQVLFESNREEYDAFQKYLNKHSQVLFNMFIGKKEIINRYCEWLFPILQRVDQYQIDSTGERYHSREIGYLGELLFSFWLDYNKIHYFPSDTLTPRKSKIMTVAGINMPQGSNVYYLNQFPVQVWKLLFRLFSKRIE